MGMQLESTVGCMLPVTSTTPTNDHAHFSQTCCVSYISLLLLLLAPNAYFGGIIKQVQYILLLAVPKLETRIKLFYMLSVP